MTSMLLQCPVLSVPPTAVVKGKLPLSDFTVKKRAAWDSFVWFISSFLASTALVGSCLHK